MSALHRAVASLAFLGVVLIGSACGVVPVNSVQIGVDTEAMPWADISGYRTYRWWQPSVIDRHQYANTIEREATIDYRIRAAIDADLRAHGYVQDIKGRPDFIVKYRIAMVEDHTSSFAEYADYRAQGGNQGLGDAFMGYQRGVLRIEIWDAATDRLAWRGTATSIADGSGRRIEPAVQLILARLPAAG